MKIKVFVLLCILVSCIVLACISDKDHGGVTGQETSGENYIDNNEDNKDDGVEKESEIPEITSKMLTYNDGKISLTYPKISGLNDVDLEDTVNELIKNEALYNMQPIEDIPEGQNYELSYETMFCDDEILSLVYKGNQYSDGAAYPNDVFFTTTIDMKEGKKLKLSDMVSDLQLLSEAYRSRLNQETEDDMKKIAYAYILDNYDETDLIEGFNEADETYGSGRYIFSYLTKDTLGISWEVPHVMGDHVEVEIPIERISDIVSLGSKGI